MASWIDIPDDSDFSLQNLPYGIFSTDDTQARPGVAVGQHVLDLQVLAKEGAFDGFDFDVTVLQQTTLNAFAALGRGPQSVVRERLQALLIKQTELGDVLRDNHSLRNKALIPLSSVKLHLPMAIGSYTDFFVGLHHAEICASVLKPGATIEQLCPSFYSLPVAYNGRASSVVVSDASFHRPHGQFPVDGKLVSGPSRKLDFEVEFACLIGEGNSMGEPIDVNSAEDHIFGFVLMNDWSARDIQMWEASLLGPLSGKSFCTTISPWVVPPEALEPFRVAPKKMPRTLLEYLVEKKELSAYDIPIRAMLGAGGQSHKIAVCNTNNVIFSFAQMIAQHTRNGCPLQTGDLMGTGTLSGPERANAGCFLEQSRNGTEPYELLAEKHGAGSVHRAFLEDNDEVTFTAQTLGSSDKVGFGSCSGIVLPAF
ncbi:hypothetical protein LTR56_014123 [Elasticomyces elasticus]|nr:hypothetical protein LTR56_014123 [Elasticomyces elasticus]KAK3662730.1 hypothetical protein LTR22_006346 [Elasticomyces elasticus]KAK4918046.1 hypothetical protein LTR49_014184 [Elasticomyces elasticus]KAK5754457.1 hypothetical protein LTS12_015412 [Elasticomyces elasticus]